MRLRRLYLSILLLFCASLLLLPSASAQYCAIVPGSYAFLVTGNLAGPTTRASHSLAVIGSIRIDSFGEGNGFEDINSSYGLVQDESITGVCTNRSDGLRDLVLTSASGQTQAFLLGNDNSLQYTGPGAAAAGFLYMQDVYALHSQFYGVSDIGLSGETACLNSCSYNHPAGAISANLTGSSLSTDPYSIKGTLDATFATTKISNQPVTGQIEEAPSGLGRFTLSLSVANEAPDLPTKFIAYVIDANSFLIISADSHANTALLTGDGSLRHAD